ncbi:polyprenyl synthetase family protein [Patescibacteria group bacterium]|nr:polyprenyl synthetase family protein [Patescibacteria group bacterium]
MSKNLFVKELAAFQSKFNSQLSKYFIQKLVKARSVSSEYTQLVKFLSAYLQAGGKRLRPFLLKQGFQIAGGKNNAQANQVGIALELFHNFALIHDDLMDGADLRRQRPTLHRQLAKWHQQRKWRGDSQEFGIGMAILAGDILLAWADELINNLKRPLILDIYQEMKSELMIGQAEDIFLSKINKIPTRQRIIKAALLKSAHYSVAKPMLMGAALENQKQKYQGLFDTLAEPLGLTFQLRDDILGVFGKQGAVGKSVSGDIEEGKMTLLMYYALRSGHLPPLLLKKTWGNNVATRREVTELKTSLKNSGALDKVSQDVDRQLTQAEKVINRSKLMNNKTKAIFLDLLIFFQTRDY